MDSIKLNKLYWGVIVRFDRFQNPISLCWKSRGTGTCRSGVNMPGWNFNICNLQVNSIAANSMYEYKLSFSLEMISYFEK